MHKILHAIHAPVSAKSFIEPIVRKLKDRNFDTQLWLEQWDKYADLVNSIKVPKKIISSDLTFNPIEFVNRLQIYRAALREISP